MIKLGFLKKNFPLNRLLQILTSFLKKKKKYKPLPHYIEHLFIFPVVFIFVLRDSLLRKYEVVKEIYTLLNFLE